ncbi:uncharacterized protein LOC130897150 isoform X2 [Diorhabda carinulata]|uniref:uncharacterized protein LOC130897150 isoform X2 n=1 Tax=Diorhabda carinulata TaxID=1163345 RepID=UPI0025A15328|nr:uncharacterized protein LOC130897150 isoform X2 [Diorhabda carinulata]
MFKVYHLKFMQIVMPKLKDISIVISAPKTLHASFRGYPLSGKIIDLPDGYVGIVLHESLRPETDKCERKFHVTNKFLKITHWNWDKEPSDNDIITQALQWVDIAEVLHSPIIEE